MSTLSKRSNKLLISLAGIATTSVFLSLPAFALAHQSSNHQTNWAESKGQIQHLLAQGSSGDAGDDGLNNEQLPSIDITNDEQPQLQPNTNQDPTGIPNLENNPTNSPTSQTEETRGNQQYSTNSNRLKPGTWICVNNPNPACNS